MDWTASNKTLRLLKFAFGLTLLGVLFFSINLDELLSIIGNANIVWTLVCVAGTMALICFQAILLGLISSPFAKTPPFRLLAFTFIGRFFSLFMPSSVGGDLIKTLYLFPYFQTRSEAYAAVIMHRVSGGLSTFVVSLVASATFLPTEYKVPVMVVGCVFVACCVVTLAGYYRYKNQIWQRVRRYQTQQNSGSGVVRVFYSLISAMLAYRHFKIYVIATLVLSGAGTVLTAGLYMLIAHTLSVPLAFDQALIAACATLISVLLPLTPGGIGVTEGAFVVAGSIMEVPPEHALAILVFARFTGYIAAIPGGILYMITPMKEPAKNTVL